MSARTGAAERMEILKSRTLLGDGIHFRRERVRQLPGSSLTDGEGRGRRKMQNRCRRIPQSLAGIQDGATPAFQKVRDLFHLVGWNAHFLQRFSKMLQKPIEMSIV